MLHGHTRCCYGMGVHTVNDMGIGQYHTHTHLKAKKVQHQSQRARCSSAVRRAPSDAAVASQVQSPQVVDRGGGPQQMLRSEEHTSELQSRLHLVCRLLLEKKKKNNFDNSSHTVSQPHRWSV